MSGYENKKIEDMLKNENATTLDKAELLMSCLAAIKTGAFDEPLSDSLLLDLAISVHEDLIPQQSSSPR